MYTLVYFCCTFYMLLLMDFTFQSASMSNSFGNLCFYDAGQCMSTVKFNSLKKIKTEDVELLR